MFLSLAAHSWSCREGCHLSGSRCDAYCSYKSIPQYPSPNSNNKLRINPPRLYLQFSDFPIAGILRLVGKLKLMLLITERCNKWPANDYGAASINYKLKNRIHDIYTFTLIYEFASVFYLLTISVSLDHV